MQGNLLDIDLNSLLDLVKFKQKSGVLLLETESGFHQQGNFYFFFFYLGKIIYIGDQQSFTLRRLQDYLSYYQLDHKLKSIKADLINSASITEYEVLILLSKKQIISREQEQDIFKQILQEILFETLALNKGFFSFNSYYYLQPQIHAFDLEELLPQVFASLRQWKQFYGYIQSSEQCLTIADNLKLKAFFNHKIYQNLSNKIDGKISLRQLARYLHQDLGTIARIIHPCLERGWIKVIKPLSNHDLSKIKNKSFFNIVCLTNEQDWTLRIRNFLTPKKYNFIITNNLSQGLENIFNLIPDLVFFELESSSLNKYQFCQIMRSSQSLIQVPIILIVNHFLFEENLKAKMSGATEYITRNVLNKNLWQIIHKYTG
jgi:twitching motility two-component system response regulator PilG